MAFTRTWDTAYEADPADTDDISNDAERLRDTKVDVRERLEQDHSWAGDADDGFHKFATMMKRGSDPSAAVDKLILYTKTNSDKLYGKEPSGETLQITPPLASGMAWFLSTEPNGYIFVDGRTLSKTGSGGDHQGERFRELFDAIKSEGYGNAGTEDFDAGDTVTLPDLRDRVPVGAASMGNSDAGRIGTYTTTFASTGGEDEHTLTVSEMPSHNHGGSVGSGGNHVHSLLTGSSGNVGNQFYVSTEVTGDKNSAVYTQRDPGDNENWLGNSGTHSHSIPTEGGDGAHNNVQPFLAVNWIIKY